MSQRKRSVMSVKLHVSTMIKKITMSAPTINLQKISVNFIYKVLYIYYLVWFQKEQVRALVDSKSKLNTVNPNFAWNLSFYIWKTNIAAKKINSSTRKTFEMVIDDFQVKDKISRPKFFQKTFLVANIIFNVILRMFFLKINNTDVSFGKKILT